MDSRQSGVDGLFTQIVNTPNKMETESVKIELTVSNSTKVWLQLLTDCHVQHRGLMILLDVYEIPDGMKPNQLYKKWVRYMFKMIHLLHLLKSVSGCNEIFRNYKIVIGSTVCSVS